MTPFSLTLDQITDMRREPFPLSTRTEQGQRGGKAAAQ